MDDSFCYVSCLEWMMNQLKMRVALLQSMKLNGMGFFYVYHGTDDI